jgi:hypothetical protein
MTVPDPASILAVAETERDQARELLAAHQRKCRVSGFCPRCTSLHRHLSRAERQVVLLTPAEPEMEGLFDG